MALAESELRFIGSSSTTRLPRANFNSNSMPDPSTLSPADVLAVIKKISNHFQIFYSPFPAAASFSFSVPEFGPYSLERYLTSENRALGTTAELAECIPQAYHALLLTPNSPLFSANFVKLVCQLLIIYYFGVTLY